MYRECECVFFSLSSACLQGGEGKEHYLVKARLAMLDKNYKLSEMHYLEQVRRPSPFLSELLL